MRATGDANGADVRSVRRRIDRAFALFRFHRGKEAQQQLDRAGAGVYVRVDAILIGRTLAGGVLRAQVPSGCIQVTAIVPSTAVGETEVTLEPGGSRGISVGLETDRTPSVCQQSWE